jgi:hypothetical protein
MLDCAKEAVLFMRHYRHGLLLSRETLPRIPVSIPSDNKCGLSDRGMAYGMDLGVHRRELRIAHAQWTRVGNLHHQLLYSSWAMVAIVCESSCEAGISMKRASWQLDDHDSGTLWRS